MKIIPLTQGKCALVDDGDFDWLSQWKWCYVNGYAERTESTLFGKKHVRMHRVIMGTPEGMLPDHKDGDGLNNQRANLRDCSQSQNLANTGKHANNTSGRKGVSWDARKKKWRADIQYQGKTICLGRFSSIEDAGHAYEVKARELYGEFARS